MADFREIKREVLRYGSQVEVISPTVLRQEVKKEIEKMRKVYDHASRPALVTQICNQH